MSARDVLAFRPLRWAVRLPAFQFLAVAPAAVAVGVVLVSAAVGIDHPSFNFGTVFTWVVWWGLLLASLVVLGRAWCLVCPVGAVGDWVQRSSLWWRPAAVAGFGFRWPRRLRGAWLPTALFLAFVWLDNGYGMANSPRLTAGLLVVLLLAAAWIGLVFERRAFCRHLCPLTAFIGLYSLGAAFELRAADGATCRTRCTTKDCFRGNARRWGCPMAEFPGAPMDTNAQCILCTECVRSCPHGNIVLRFRAPGRDVWAARHRTLDAAVGACAVVAVPTTLPLVMLALLPRARALLALLLPTGDLPRLVAMTVLFGGGVAGTIALVYGFAALAGGLPQAPALFRRYALAIVPLGIARLIADFVDHVSRTWGAVVDATHALVLDFPFNQVVPGRSTLVHLAVPTAVYLAQVVLLLAGLAVSLAAGRRALDTLVDDRRAALAAFLPMAALAFVLTLIGIWTLGQGLL